MEYTLEQLRAAYDKLPQNIKNAIDSIDSKDIFLSVRKNHNLTIEQMGDLADETGLVMMGLTHPKDFMGNIKKRLNINSETAQKITQEVNEGVFAPIKESLVALYSTEKKAGGKGLTAAIESTGNSYREPVEMVPEHSPESKEVHDASLEQAKVRDNAEKSGLGNKEERLPSKEDVLREIEGVSDSGMKSSVVKDLMAKQPVTAPKGGIVEQKLGGQFELTRTKTQQGRHPAAEEEGGKKTNGSDSRKNEDEKKETYQGADPYREDIA